jgi:hypothetical protein
MSASNLGVVVRIRFAAAVLAVTVMFGEQAFAQGQGGAPFGLRPEMTLAELRKLGNLEDKGVYWYSVKRLPSGHPDIEEYRLLVTPKHGLCKIIAWTGTIESNSYGQQLKEVYERFFTALASKYGNSKRFDFLRSGSIWNESRDFMMGLAKKERVLNAYWDQEEKSDLPSEIRSIEMVAHAVSSGAGAVSISYELHNASECMEWRKKQKDANL